MVFNKICLLLGLTLSITTFAYSNPSDILPLENSSQDQQELPGDPAQFQLIAEENSFQADKSLSVAIKMTIADGWHSYWKNPGEMGMPIKINWTLPEGFAVTELQWPTPTRFEQNGVIGYGYESEIIFLADIIPPKNLAVGESSTIEATAQWLACSDATCLPGESQISLKIPHDAGSKSSNTQIQDQDTKNLFSNARTSSPKKGNTDTNIKVLSSNKLIIIQLDNSLTPCKKVTFFPESKQIIDESSQAVHTPSGDKLNCASIVLKENDSSKATTLKGVLVLENDTTIEAWDIDLPIERDAKDQLVGIADKLKLPSQQTQEISTTETSPEMSFPLAFLFAFLGGLMLNLMPCVLPVVSLKILSFVKMASQSRKITFQLGLAFFFGVIASFWVLGGVLLLLQSYGHSIGWGFQLQEPLFVAFLAALLLLSALSFFGVFEIGTSLTSIAGQAQQNIKAKKSALFSSFCSGILATAVATPCTGPLLGAPIALAVSLSPILAMLIFTALGAGMALPYLLLAAYPSLLRFIPKPGAWMVTFKELMGFIMLATVIWLLWVFQGQAGNVGLFILLFALLILAFGVWIYGRWCTAICSKLSRYIGTALTLTCVGISFYALTAATTIESDENSSWEAYSPERVEALKKQGTPVLIDFTAKWCGICQFNHIVLSNSNVTKKLSDHKVVKMKADWTSKDPTITKALHAFGRNGVPLYILTGKNHDDAFSILPQVLTPGIVIDHLNEL